MARDRILQIYRGTTAQNNAFTGAAGELTMDTDRKEIRIHDGSTAGGNVVGLTPGFIAPFAGSTAPDGWLVCDGSAISRTRYADLFAVIGTTYGEGDGNSTFNLPNFDGYLPTYDSSAALGTSTNGKAPNITGWIYPYSSMGGDVGGAFGVSGGNNTASRGSGVGWQYSFDASRCSSVYDTNATKITTAGINTLICIKF